MQICVIWTYAASLSYPTVDRRERNKGIEPELIKKKKKKTESDVSDMYSEK